MDSFVGRASELAELRSELDLVRESGRARFVWMRGRRRVGKSRLMQEFCDRSQIRYCFYQAPRRPRPDALADFVEAVRESDLAAAEAFAGVSYDSWPAAQRAAAAGPSPSDPAIVVIDELPYLTELDPGFAADLQKAWDRTLEASPFERELQARKVIEAIGHGETAYSRIQSRAGVKGNTLTAALEVLVEAKRLVTKEFPYAAPPGRTAAKYTVIDPYLRFWLRFVGPHIAELSRGRSDLVVKRIMRDWSAFRGQAVEPVVREGLERLLAGAALSERLDGARHVGSWWRRDHSVEVDLVGGDAPEPARIGFIGSIKWHEREPFAAGELRELAGNRARVPGAAAAKLVVVSRTGVENGVATDATFGPAD